MESGIISVSSWSSPRVLCPFRASTPTTVNGTALIRTVWSMRIGAAEEVLGDGLPQHDHLARRVHVLRREEPARHRAPVAGLEVFRPSRPAARWTSCCSRTRPARRRASWAPRPPRSGTSRWIARASSSVIVSRLPEPSRTPPEVMDPESTMIRFDPRLRICSATRACAPAPMAIIVTTAPTPMITPSAVSAVRSRLVRSAAAAIWTVAEIFMPPGPAAGPAPPRRPPASRRGTMRMRCAYCAMSGSCVTSTMVSPVR